MTQKHEKDSKSSDPKKVRFPTPPWKKKVSAETEAPVEDKVAAEEAPAQEAPAEKPAEAEAVEPEVVAEAAPAGEKEAEAPKSEAASEAKKEDSHFTNLADAFLKVQAALKKTQDELETTKAELAKATDGYTRAVADFDNYRRRTAKEKDGIYADAYADALKGILPILDNLERAVGVSEVEALQKGLSMTLKGAEDALAKMGVTAFGEKGETFDPEKHNAVMHIEDEQYGESEITEVYQKGYAKGDKILRFAMVKVAN